MGSIFFGPVIGGVGAALGDILGFIIFPTGDISRPHGLRFFDRSHVRGAVLKKQPSFVRSLIASVIVCLLFNALLNSYWLYLALQSYAFWTCDGSQADSQSDIYPGAGRLKFPDMAKAVSHKLGLSYGFPEQIESRKKVFIKFKQGIYGGIQYKKPAENAAGFLRKNLNPENYHSPLS